MAQESGQKGGDLFIVDNSDQDWKVRLFLRVRVGVAMCGTTRLQSVQANAKWWLLHG
jgi:hypothetical protein